MSSQPTPSLADTFASLSFNAPPGAGRRITSKSLDALIAAIFARIFARLEQILRLWQAGTLPVPAPRARATHPHPPAARSPPAPKPPPRAESALHRAAHARNPSPRSPPESNRPIIPPRHHPRQTPRRRTPRTPEYDFSSPGGPNLSTTILLRFSNYQQ